MIHHETKQDRRGSQPSRFIPDWNEPEMPVFRVLAAATYRQLTVMQATIDRMLPLAVSQPVSVVYTRDAEAQTGWTFTGVPLHDTIRAKVETLADTVADAVTVTPY